MAIKSSTSKTFAIIFAILTATAIAGIVTLVIVYNKKISVLDPTARPPLTTPTYPTGPPPNHRLPGNLVPESYEVYLQPHFYTRITEEVNVTSPNQTRVFTGNSTVNFHCLHRTRTIYLHSKDLTLSGISLLDRDTKEKIQTSSPIQHEIPNDFLELQVERELEERGNYSLFMAFSGEMSAGNPGMILCKYKDASSNDSNTERFVVVTHMEPTDARRVFPCFDEPELKAEFTVTITHRRGTTALGNWDMSESTVIDDEWKFTQFHTTKRMSTYLFAFSVSEFTALPSPHPRVKILTYARPEAIRDGHADYTASITGRILKFFEERFQMDFPQKKLDQIAVPNFNVAAMENWGLVTYAEGNLLFEDGVSSFLEKENIVRVVAHELAHQWFGNLVTMKWWSEAWLKEGFATYLQYLTVSAVEPGFQTHNLWILGILQAAFEVDTLASAHPLSSPTEAVQTIQEIFSKYDSITYHKGAAVLRMLEDMVTERVFNAGVKKYLSAFQYGNTVKENLWDCMQKAVDEDGGHIRVAKVMDTWTTQHGFPIITINTANGEAQQRHFTFNQSASTNQVWHVPVRVKSKTSTPSLVWLGGSSTVTKEEFISKDGEWILANFNGAGYYIVNYDSENWARLLNQLETDSSLIPVVNRGKLVQDAFYMARAKVVDITLALNTTRFLWNELEFTSWITAVDNLDYLYKMFDRSEVYGPMQAYLRKQVRGLYNFYRNYTDNSTVPSDHLSQLAQIEAVGVACKNRLPECINMAKAKFAEWMKDETINNIQPNLRADIYCYAVAAGGDVEWEFVWRRLQMSEDLSEREQLRRALSCTREVWLLNRYLQHSLDPDATTDAGSIISAVASNVAGQALAWNFLRAHWADIKDGVMGFDIDGITGRFSTEYELQELRNFQMDNSEDPDFPNMDLEQAIEQTQINIQWVQDNKQNLLEWFQSQQVS